MSTTSSAQASGLATTYARRARTSVAALSRARYLHGMTGYFHPYRKKENECPSVSSGLSRLPSR